MSLYPIKCKPRFKGRTQGGTLLSTLLRKNIKGKCSECWDISGLQKDISVVSNGFLEGNNLEELTEIYLGDMVGDSVYERYGVEFPLMVKWIHATQNSPVQVHPGNEMASEQHGCFGNNKWWYILDAEPGAQIRIGFETGLTERQFLDALQQQKIEGLMHLESVVAGDCFSVPAGTLHSIGKGILLLEIGQTSEVAYVIHYPDDPTRGIHPDDISLALEATDRRPAGQYRILWDEPEWNAIPSFAVRKVSFKQRLHREYIDIDSFVLYVCVEGESRITGDGFEPTDIQKGETVLIPAGLKSIVLKPYTPTVLFEIYIK